MNLRPGSLAVAAAIMIGLASLSPPHVNAQPGGECEEGIPHCGPYSEDPGDGCLGPDDPFCNGGGGGGGGGGTNTGCRICLFIHEGPNGEPAYHYCADIAGPNRLNDCEAFANGCSSNGFCVWV
jgi:hypothetical protein